MRKEVETCAHLHHFTNRHCQIYTHASGSQRDRTIQMIENAERFGLAQLHQLRGRVGRGKHQSYCIFMSASKSKETKKRLDILNHSNDGFKIASEDLRLRGPGDLFGIRQSGLMNFKLGDVYQDAKILQMANEAADQLTEEDEEWIRKLPNYENAAEVVL